MSNSLLRKSLELAGYEDLKQEKKKKKRTKIKYEGTFDLIPPKHRIISKREKTDLGTVLHRSGKITVFEAKKRLEKQEDPTEKNIEKLLKLSSSRLDLETADKLLDRAVKKPLIKKHRKEVESESTAFTEEDFKKFEQEYTE